jgi:hypothetical protein
MKSIAVVPLICLALLTGCRTIQYAPKYESIVATSTNTPTPTKTSVTPTPIPITPKPGFESEAIAYPEIWDLYLHHGPLDPIFAQLLVAYKKGGVDAAIKFAEPYKLVKDRSVYIELVVKDEGYMPAVTEQLEKLGVTVEGKVHRQNKFRNILVPMDNGDLVKTFAKLAKIPHIEHLRPRTLYTSDSPLAHDVGGTISQTPTATPCPTITYPCHCPVCGPRTGVCATECCTWFDTCTKQVCPTP